MSDLIVKYIISNRKGISKKIKCIVVNLAASLGASNHHTKYNHFISYNLFQPHYYY